jgi:DNA mismatch endonuclease (patch repair protein)
LVFGPRRKVIFVHGCFWHGHDDPNCVDGRRKPKSNLDYWLPKLTRNRMRDEEHVESLITLGWSVFLVWECQIKYKDVLADKIRAFLK